MKQFEFGFDPRFRLPLMMVGVMPATSYARIDDEKLKVRFGPWKFETPLSNITCAKVTENYKWYKAIGARGSFTDRGLTFGTNAERGVCVLFSEPVPALVPGDVMPHPGATLTLADIDGFLAELAAHGVEPVSSG